MKTETYKLAGVQVDIQVPSTLDEAKEIAGEEKVLAAYVDHIVYHPLATAARSRLAAKLAEQYKNHPRLTRTEGDKTIVDESPNDYVARLKKDADLDDDVLQPLLQSIINDAALAFAKVAKAERAPSQAKPGKSFYEIVAKKMAKPDGATKLAADLERQLSRPFDPTNVDDLARGVQEVMHRITTEAAARKKALEASLASD